MKITFNPSTVAALTSPPNNKDITFDLKGHNIFARGVEFKGTDTNTWRDIKINNVSIGSNILDLRNGTNTTLTNVNGVVTISSTWRPIIDNLISDSTTSSLSANQGRVLKALIDGKSDSGHNHDDRYLRLIGGTLSGALSIITPSFGALIIQRDDATNGASIQFKGSSSIYGYIGFNKDSKDKQLLRWNSSADTSFSILDTSTTYVSSNKGYINGTEITQVNNANKWTAARTFTIGNTSKNVDGSNNVSWSLSEIGAASSGHNHDGRYVRYYTVTTLDCNNLAAGLTAASVNATNAGAAYHSAYLYISDVGTPFQIQIPDSGTPYIYKRYYSSGKWSGWFKLNAGYADSAGSVAWANVTGKPSSFTPSAHTHAWNSLTHSSTTANQAILTNGSANGWKLYTLNIGNWDNAASKAHSHSNKSVLDGITSALVSNWNTAYTFVDTITKADTDKVINKWSEIVNFLSGIDSNNKLNTLLNSKLSVYELAAETNVGAIKNNGIYYSTTDASSGTLTNSPFSNGFALINMTSYDGGDDLRRSRLAFNGYGEIKVSNDRGQAGTAETWYQVLTSHNTYISNGSGIINGTTITQVANADTTDGVHLEWEGELTYDQYSWLAAWTNDGKKIKTVKKSQFATAGHTHDGRYVQAFGTSNDNIDSDWGQSFKTFDPIPSGTPPEKNPNISLLSIGENFNRRKQLAFVYSSDNIYYRRHVDGRFTNWVKLLHSGNSYVTNGEGVINGVTVTQVANSDTVDGIHANGLFTALSNSNNGISITIGGTTKSINNISVNHASSATKVIVNQHTANDINYPLIWSNQSNTSSVTENQLYKSWADLYYNPKNKRLTVGGSVVSSSFIKNGGNEDQLLRADGGVAAFNWAGQPGQPTWLWGGNNFNSYYVYNPSNFRVAYAETAGSADNIGGVPLSGIFTAFGNNGNNITATIGGITKEFQVNYAINADKLDGYHENSFLRYRGYTSTDQEDTLWDQIGIKEYAGALPDNLTDVYNWGSVISLPSEDFRFEIYASDWSSNGNGLYYRSGYHSNKKPWCKFIDSSNIGSQSVAYANSAGNASTLGEMPRNYGQNPFNTIPCVGGDGIMEIGRYIDYHYDNSGKYDFSTRLQVGDNYSNIVTLPSRSGTLALTSDILNPTDYYWANVKISASSSTSTSPTVSNLTATNSINVMNILLGHGNEINSDTGLHLNYRYSSSIGLCNGGGNVCIGTFTVSSYKLDVRGTVRSTGFYHDSHNSNDAVLLAGGDWRLDNIQFRQDSVGQSYSSSYPTTQDIKKYSIYQLKGNSTLHLPKPTIDLIGTIVFVKSSYGNGAKVSGIITPCNNYIGSHTDTEITRNISTNSMFYICMNYGLTYSWVEFYCG